MSHKKTNNIDDLGIQFSLDKEKDIYKIGLSETNLDYINFNKLNGVWRVKLYRNGKNIITRSTKRDGRLREKILEVASEEDYILKGNKFKKKPEKAKEKNELFNTFRHPLLAGLVFTFISIFIYSPLKDWVYHSPPIDLLKNVTKPSDDFFDIAILPFYNYNSESSSGIGLKIKERLEELKVDDSLNLNIEFINLNKNYFFNNSDAKKILEDINYDLIIYGDFIEGQCEFSDKICVNYVTKSIIQDELNIQNHTKRKLENYKDADVFDIMSGKLQQGFEDIIYFINTLIAVNDKEYERAFRLISKIKNESRDPEIEETKANILWIIHKYKLSSNSYELAGDYYLERRDSNLAFESFSRSGSTIVQLSDFNQALSKHKKAYNLIIGKPNINRYRFLTSLENLAISYEQLNDSKNSKKYIIQALDSLNAWNDPSLTFKKSYLYLSLSLIDIQATDIEDTLEINEIKENVLRGELICLNIISDQLTIEKTECLYNLGRFYRTIRNFSRAEELFSKAIELNKGTFQEKRIFDLNLYYQLAVVLAKQNKYNKALNTINIALRNSQEIFGYNKFEEAFINLKNEIIEIERGK